MNTNRRTAITVGVLYILGTLAGILSAITIGSILTDPDYLIQFSANQNQIILATLFVLIMGFALAMIPVVLFPIFKQYNEALALGAIVFRGALEAFAYIGIVVAWLVLLFLSQEFVRAGAPMASYYQSLGSVALTTADWLNKILAIIFSLGALMIYSIFYQSQLIPRWLALWGLIGAILYLVQPLLAMFGFTVELLLAPLALQEKVLALWLIIRGFSSMPRLSKVAEASF